jgi:hypothetical protein
MGVELVLLAAIAVIEPSVQAPITADAIRRTRVDKMLEEQYARSLSIEERARVEKAALYLLPFIERRVTFRVEF